MIHHMITFHFINIFVIQLLDGVDSFNGELMVDA